MSNEALLQHHGILGMKWGVRRTPEQLARASGKKNSSDDEVKKMSDSELRSKINRLQMEKQYKQLTSSEISVGRKFVQDVLTNAAKQTATHYVSKYMTKGNTAKQIATNYVSKYMTKGIDAVIKKATSK